MMHAYKLNLRGVRVPEDPQEWWGQLILDKAEFDEKDHGPEFVSQIEQVRKAKELLFEPAPGFGKYRIYFPKSDGKNPDAVAHPAKMHVGFCEYLITRYTKPGETILDPMSGAGTTAAVGAPLGRNVVTVELEGKFVDWQKGLKQKIEEAPMLMKGEITVIKGDARRLSQLLGVVDAEVVSPPYSASLRRKNRNVKDLDRLRKAGYSDKWIEQHHDQPNQNIAISGQGYSKDPGNIGNLAHGKIDGVVMSPPYSLGIGHGTGASTEKIAQEKELGVRGHGSYSGTIDGIVTSPPYNTRTDGEGLNKTAIPNVRGVMQGRTETMKYSNDRVGNIGEIKTHGNIDAVITSPAYSDSLGKGRKGYTTDPQLAKTRQYGQDTSDANLGNLKHGSIDAVITSPPYASGSHDGEKGPASDKLRKEKGIHLRGGDSSYGSTEGNIQHLQHNLGEIDGILTSPPYEGSEAFQDTDFKREISGDLDAKKAAGKIKGHSTSARMLKYKAGAHVGQGHAPSSAAEARFLDKAERGRIEHPDSLGKLTKETYLQAMKKVYENMFIVLKPGGLAVIVVKAFNRNKRVVDLPWQTWLLLHAVGFGFEDVVKMRIRNLSFWRIMLYKKYPSIDRIRHEYAIVVRKPASSNMEV
jgi:DNA modification methylase